MSNGDDRSRSGSNELRIRRSSDRALMHKTAHPLGSRAGAFIFRYFILAFSADQAILEGFLPIYTVCRLKMPSIYPEQCEFSHPNGNQQGNAVEVIHDAFQPLSSLAGFMPSPDFDGVVLDTHYYNMFSVGVCVSAFLQFCSIMNSCVG